MSRSTLAGNGRRREPRGLWIAVFGPDGVGKSAAIERLPEQLGAAFRGYDRFHFRPSVGRLQQQPPVTAPHAEGPRGLMISISKLLYWLLDCWAGHIFQVLFAVRRSHLVVFDRYLPDLLVDPVRYRLPASASRIAAAVVKLAPRADLCVLLDAPAEIVHQRKWELPLLELQRQRAAYSRLFESLPRTLVLDASRSVEEVNRQFVELLRSYMLLVRGCELGDREMPESRAGVPA